MAKILVTGGAGYIGSHTVHHLLRDGHEVVVVDNLVRGHRDSVPTGTLREVDLMDHERLAEIFVAERVDAVIHFAGLIAVGESTVHPESYFWNNLAGSVSLFSAMEKAGVKRLVFSSSAAVYGTPATVPIREDTRFAPLSPYGESKAEVERMLGWLDRCRGLRSVSLRYFNACGAEPGTSLGERHDPETHLIPLLFRSVLKDEPITIFGDDYDTPDGSCIRDYIHVSDLATAHLAALDWLLEGGETDAMNAGTGRGHSVWEVLRVVEEVTGRKVPHNVGERRPGDPPALIANSDKLQQKLGWNPKYTSIRDAVETAWNFEKANLR